jgi:hypothetical protein
VKVAYLPGAVGGTLEWAQGFEAPQGMIVLVKTAEGAWSLSWSTLSCSDLAYAERCLRIWIDRHMIETQGLI